MRPIDGDKLLARYKERCAGCKETKNYCEHCCDLADVISDIEDAPTVDAVERKKGKWIVDGRHPNYLLRCSACQEIAMWAGGISYIYPNFCPKCGADMRGEQDA